ncbi:MULTISPECIES: SMI1/KNR4 family protein [unclassified Variovorax]|uniref:SMI1/KNR4 family protein n=1 Tax=unclassified Variovorax TaxID=663243 RepID=UPI002577F3AA|nr:MULTISPECIES: SMI1/KNR4 family protein [unclassified Variovorax]MDM0090491.1 SMI1/KNR4 family protein [Variovorax sp. J22G40]MDM0147844.1 SMI1/KNR4 family protein [Variovorax sp. J2P1-31]
MNDIRFTSDERAALRAHGIVLFAERVIFDAQPPMPASQIAAVQALCAGPLPEALLALWQQTAGGRLDYDLTLEMNGNIEAVSWSELFWNGSDGYRDLQGWIVHEQELAEEAAEDGGPPWQGTLALLPFGGFEYCDRIYAVVEPGADYGRIVAWKQGLPPAWTHALHEDGLSVVAADLPAAFAALHLDDDPLAPTSDYFSGQTLLAYLDDRHQDHGLGLDLMDKLVAFYRLAMHDWRTPLAEGTLRHQPALARAALRHAVATDDAALIVDLAAAGLRFEGPLQGSALATDVALAHGAFVAAAALVRAGAPVAADALRNIDGQIGPELTAALLANGAEPDVEAIVQCAACGAPASAHLIAEACSGIGIDVPTAFDADRAAKLQELESALAQLADGHHGHYLGREGLAQRIERLQGFRL